jgi:Protein of unknown function (DUF2752)
VTSERQLGFLWGSVSLALIAASPLAGRLAAALPGCPFKALFDLPCPSCGVTRAAMALATLDIAGAVSINPLATVAWIVLIVGGLVAGTLACLDQSPPEPAWQIALGVRWLSVLLVLVNWAYLLRAGS